MFVFLKKSKYLSRNGRRIKFSKGSLEGATSLVFLLGKVKRGEEVEIQNKIDLHLFNVFIVFPFYLLLSRNSN
jgi:hypothetical protein